MADTRWTTYSSLAGLQAGLSRMSTDVLGFADDPGHRPGFCAWRPPVDILQTGEGYVLYAEIPGVDRKDITIEIRNDVLTLSGKRRAPEGCPAGEYLRGERIFGRFERSFSLPSSVDPVAVRASFKNGVLQVSIPGGGTEDSRKIDIE